MAYISTGLPNSGLTQYFGVTYDSTLPNAQGLQVALDLMSSCDDDYRLLAGWFRGTTNMPGRLPVYVNNSTGGASWWGWGPIYNITLGLGEQVFGVSPSTYARYLLISEVSEIFMRQRQFLPNYWFSASNEGNKGEALSCFLANEFLSLIHESSMPRVTSGPFAKAPSWLASTRSNFLNLNDANIDPSVNPEISCGISFLNYLSHQRGISIADVIGNGSDTFEGVFENLGLGNRTAAFPTFLAAVNSHYAQDTRLSTSPMLDNIFPAPELSEFIATPQVSWVSTGLAPRGIIVLSTKVPMDVLVMLSTDRPDLLSLPVDRIVRRGGKDDEFSFSVAPQPAPFVSANATITVEYAGITAQRLVQVYAPSAWPMPPLQIVPEAPADLCADGFVAGTKQAFSVGNLSAFPSRAGLQLHWQVHNATGSAMANETFVIAALPAPGTRVELTVTATNSDGVTASGSLDFTVQSAKSGLAHELANLECRIRHIVDMVNRLPRLPIPENKAKREEVLVNIAVHAKDLAAQATELAKEARKVSAGKSK